MNQLLFIATKNRPKYINILRSYVGGMSDDIFQDVLIRLYYDKRFVFTNEFSTHKYILRCCKNEAVNYIRKAERESRIEINTFDDINNYSQIWDLIKQLNDNHRICLLLHYKFKMKYMEIATYLDISINTVKSRIRLSKIGLKNKCKL